MIYGNINGISKATMAKLEGIYDMNIDRDCFISEELLGKIVELTSILGREISIYINRRGDIMNVSVGDISQVSLPFMRLRRSDNRLSGIRCIHTHPGGSGELSKVDYNTLNNIRFDAITAVGVKDNKFSTSYTAILEFVGNNYDQKTYGPLSINQLCSSILMERIIEADKNILQTRIFETDYTQNERAILIGIDDKNEENALLEELEGLAETAGARVLDKFIQKRRMPDTATYIGRGKAAELFLLCQQLEANIVIADDELTAVQIRNLEEILGLRVIDRTILIMDIFAARAVSREGKLQVELAQLKYRLPRLRGIGMEMSRLGGGIGTRGPGEKKLETDRRHIRRRIQEIQEELDKVKNRREALRKRRQKKTIPIVALVGYTNAGKSTLMNSLCGSDVWAEDKLFATLDPVSRGLVLEDSQEIILIDTVGFINKLPHDLIEAFQSTLEEAVDADLLLHVIDAGNKRYNEQIAVVNKVLNQLNIDKPVIEVFNKMDTVNEQEVLGGDKSRIYISAYKKRGLDELMHAIQAFFADRQRTVSILVPYEDGKIISDIHECCNVVSQDYKPEGIFMDVVVNNTNFGRLKKFII